MQLMSVMMQKTTIHQLPREIGKSRFFSVLSGKVLVKQGTQNTVNEVSNALKNTNN